MAPGFRDALRYINYDEVSMLIRIVMLSMGMYA